jgi:hypothetical protein
VESQGITAANAGELLGCATTSHSIVSPVFVGCVVVLFLTLIYRLKASFSLTMSTRGAVESCHNGVRWGAAAVAVGSTCLLLDIVALVLDDEEDTDQYSQSSACIFGYYC